MDDLQFYPTPSALGKKAWGKFKNRNFTRVLEPSAGNGDLAYAITEDDYRFRHRRGNIDVCELDISKHPTLRAKGLPVVGLDFLQMKNGAIYSHILMNPPFAVGAQHLLHAWKIVWDAEIVCIINAETIRNACTKERQMLVNLILQHGEVEYIEGAFAVEDAERKTNVDVALVYLRKQANVSVDIVGSLLEELNVDSTSAESLAGDYREAQELALPKSMIENSVAAFNAAVRAMREAVIGEARAQYYARLLGQTMAARNGDAGSSTKDTSVDYVQAEVGKRYNDLKDRAWSSILRSSDVTSHLSSAAQKRVEKEFDEIKKLEFSVTTIYGFLCGIVESKGQIQIDMCCDVFDEITRYHTDNTVFFKGWKSNDLHRTQAMKIKASRFVLPNHKSSWSGDDISYESKGLLSDFDKVTSMLDAKGQIGFGLRAAFDQHFDDLKAGKRVKTDYFDVRYYKGIGTIHFYPTRPDIIDRLNRIVGRHRAYLPPPEAGVSEAFWV
ncbi:MAG: DUF4942 domain-containing protein, partial [Gallionellaceae bacterium]